MSKSIVNNPSLKGQLASRKRLFGPWSRYAVAAVHTRFDHVVWMVWDSETIDPETDLIDVIRIADTEEKAVEGLPLS